MKMNTKKMAVKMALLLSICLVSFTNKSMIVSASEVVSENDIAPLKGKLSDHIMGYYKHLDSTTMKANFGYALDIKGTDIVASFYDDYLFEVGEDFYSFSYDLSYGNENMSSHPGFRKQGEITRGVVISGESEKDEFILSFQDLPDTSFYDDFETGHRGAYCLSVSMAADGIGASSIYTREIMIHKENGELFFYFIDSSGAQQFINTEKFRQYLNRNCNPEDYDEFKNVKYTNLLERSEYDEYISKAKELTSDCRTVEQKVWVLHDYICYNFYYDYVYSANGYQRSEGETFWSTRGGICQDFADLFMIMAQGCNIPCVEVAGQGHALNAVYAEGEWHFIDCTNDCPNRYHKEGDNKIGGTVYYSYYANFPFIGRTPSSIRNYMEDTSEEDAKRLEEEVKKFEEEQKESFTIVEWTIDKKFGLTKGGSIYDATTGQYISVPSDYATWDNKESIYIFFGYEVPEEYKTSKTEKSSEDEEKSQFKKQTITVAKKFQKTYCIRKKKIKSTKTFDMKVKVTTEGIGHGKVSYKVIYPKGTTNKQKKLFTVKKGKITVKRGVKKGTYKIKITAAEAGTLFKKATKTVKIKIK